MKNLIKSLLIAGICGLHQTTLNAQDENYFEIGPSILSFNALTSSLDEFRIQPQLEVLNGVFCRYNISDISIRGYAAFNKYENNKSAATKILGGQRILPYDSSSYVGYKVGAGIQYNLENYDYTVYPIADIFMLRGASQGRLTYFSQTTNESYTIQHKATQLAFGAGAKYEFADAWCSGVEFTRSLFFCSDLKTVSEKTAFGSTIVSEVTEESYRRASFNFRLYVSYSFNR